jgi:hypothetical protein
VRFVSRADVRGPYSQESASAIADVNPAELVSKIQAELAQSMTRAILEHAKPPLEM